MKTLLIISFMLSAFHPVHVSFTTVEYNADQESLTVMSRIFHDDLLLAVQNQYGDKVSMDSLNYPQHLKPLIRYYNDKVHLSVNNRPVDSAKLQFERFEKGDMAVRLFFSIPVKDDDIEHLGMKNEILTRLYPDQSNLLIMKINNKEESFRLTSDNNKVTLSVQ